jgi:hypothetical protein
MGKITVLTEYKIIDKERERFLGLLKHLKNNLLDLGAVDVLVYEGVDQPGLFVEEFIVEDKDAYSQMKKVRNSELTPFWQEFHTCILGGNAKVHIWAFQKIEL